jgi:oligopeptide transport system permease protein
MSEPAAANTVAEPEVAAARFSRDAWHSLRRKPTFLVAAAIIVAMLVTAAAPGPIASLFGHGNPHDCNLADSGLPPSLGSGHPFGFDIQGCDLYANVIYGARPSIAIGLLATASIFVVSIILGSIAGFYGGLIDTLVSRLIDVFFGFPFILGAIIVLISFPSRNVWTVAGVLALFSWPTGTRLMRSSVLGLRDADFVVASRALGASNRRLIVRHVIPNAIAPLLVLATLTVGTIIAAEATLTFLGVGLQLPAISWGLQLSTGQGYIETDPHMLLFPSLFLGLTVLGFILLGDALRDAFDPKIG